MSLPLLTAEGDHGQREALRYRTLRQIADAMVVHREPRDLFRELASRLKKALSFNFINFVGASRARRQQRDGDGERAEDG